MPRHRRGERPFLLISREISAKRVALFHFGGRLMKIILAYSGGLDTSVILRWLIETYKAEVICFAERRQ